MKILWVKAGGLVPADTGGKIRSYNILRQLAKYHEVTFFSFYAAHNNDIHKELTKVFQRVVLTRLDLPIPKGAIELLDYATHLFSREPYNLTKYCRPMVQKKLRALLEQERYDVILCDFLAAAGAIPWGWPCPKVLFTHNAESAIWQRHFEVTRNLFWKAVSWLEWKRMAQAEQKYLGKADHVITVSENDRDNFARLVDIRKLSVTQTGVDTDYFQPGNEKETLNSLVFTGSMDWLANEDGIVYFASQILPLIQRRLPDVTLSVVGRNPSRRLQDLASRVSNIKLTGWVEDVRPYLAKASVCIVPLRIGGGTRLKIYEAMSMAKPVVSTSIGAEGLPVVNREHLIVADDPSGFAQEVLKLLSNASYREQIGQAARHFVEQSCSWTTVTKVFVQTLDAMVKEWRCTHVVA